MTIFKKIWQSKFLFPLLLALIGGIIAWQNYTPNTWLTGWDTLHPEFNLNLAWSRILSGVWRSDQGLGASAIQSHMSELPRLIYLTLSGLVIPENFLRYSYFFVMLISGPIGVYFLMREILGHKKNANLIGFISGLAYLTNLGTVQHFIVPLEMFATLFGLFPWIIWLTNRILVKFSYAQLFAFAVIIFIATSLAHTATLFYAFIGCYIIYLLSIISFNPNRWISLSKRAIVLTVVILAINAYWMLPNIYSVIVHSAEVQNSKVNQLFSPEAFAKNQEFGNIADTAILKNFLFDWKIYNPADQTFVPVMAAWQKHLDNPAVSAIGYGMFGLAILGIFYATSHKQKFGLAFLPIAIFSFVIILNGTYPINLIFEKLSTVSPLLKEALRFPFTKFSIPFMLSQAIFIAYGILAILEYSYSKKLAKTIVYGLIPLSMLIYFAPAFNGNLISRYVKVRIPDNYFQMFNWFDKQPIDDRVAILPIQSFWNWTYYSWGYQGAGFLQFGIPQPILDRDYDRWSTFNEQYEREMSYAVYSQDPNNLALTLAKYNIRYVLFDESVIAPGDAKDVTLDWLIPNLLLKSGVAAPVKKFGSVQIYEITNSAGLVQNLPIVNSDNTGSPVDNTYNLIGNYVSNQADRPDNFTRSERYTATISGTVVERLSPGTIITDSANKCSTDLNYPATKAITDNAWVYQSTGGSLCDHFSLPKLAHDATYLVTITSKNVSGFPLQLCISNSLTRHCDLYTELNKNNLLTSETFVLPPLSDLGSGYSFNLNNYAIKGSTSINALRSIVVRKTTDEVFKNTDLANLTNLSVITNNQAYEPGWLAYEVNSKLEKDLPILYGKLLTNHVMVNNWENAWVVQNDQAGKQIVFIFWPQYLEWFGLGIGFLTIIFIVTLWSKEV